MNKIIINVKMYIFFVFIISCTQNMIMTGAHGIKKFVNSCPRQGSDLGMHNILAIKNV